MTERKAFTPTEFKLSETGEVLVAFSRLDVVDLDGDVTRHGAIPAGKAVPMSDYGHTSWDGALPIGKGVLGESGDYGTFTGAFFMDTDQGRNGYATVKAMAELQEWSYGYAVLDGGPVTLNGTNAREIRSLDVYEVSPVLKGAGVGTHTIAIKADAPGTDVPWAEHLSWFGDRSAAFLDHATARAAMREAEGRKLSRSDRDGIREQRDMLAAILSRLDDLLVEPEVQKAAERQRASLLVEIERARSLGVPI
jgi:hypothetical protein